jgi:hypothetical protein
MLYQVNWTVMREWVARRVTELLGIEEEVGPGRGRLEGRDRFKLLIDVSLLLSFHDHLAILMSYHAADGAEGLRATGCLWAAGTAARLLMAGGVIL